MEIYSGEGQETGSIMTNKLTLSLDPEIVQKLRSQAAAEGLSINDFLSTRLLEVTSQRKGYERSKKSALARLRECSNYGWTRPASRDELHER
jgi:hypothetical protein